MKQIKKELSYRAIFSPADTIVNDDDLDFTLSAKIEYDERGNVVLNETFDDHGTLVQVTECLYDEQNRLIHEKQFFAEDEVEEIRELTYGENDRILSEKRIYPYSVYDIMRFSYDQNGKLVLKELKDEEGELSEVRKFEYQGDNLVKEIVEDSDGELIESIESDFDEKNQLTSRHEFRAIDNVPFRTDYEYDEYGNRIAVKRYNSSGKILERISLEYDEAQRVKMIKEETAASTRITTFYFDEHGRSYREEVTDLTGNVLSGVERSFNSEGLQNRSEVRINLIGRASAYVLKLEYEYFNQ